MKIYEQITEKTWCKGEYARSAWGSECWIDDPGAVAWCFLGWVEKTYGYGKTEEVAEWGRRLPGGSISDWQDAPERTLSEIKELMAQLDL